MASNWAGGGRSAFKGTGQVRWFNPGPQPLEQRSAFKGTGQVRWFNPGPQPLEQGRGWELRAEPRRLGRLWERRDTRLGSRRAGSGLAVPSSGLDSSGGAVVDECAGPLGGGTAQSLQGKSHENPALADGGAGVGRQKVNEA
jgi:hypothetical protein